MQSRKPTNFNQTSCCWTSASPGISGIEAARQIRKVSPKSKIIFLSQHDSLHVANEALGAGGHGYVTKVDAGSELLKAIRIVGEGTRFVSQRIVDQGWTAPKT